MYKFEDFINALKSLQGTELQMWLGEGCGARAKKQALVNIAAFLGQAMRETIMYDACEYVVTLAPIYSHNSENNHRAVLQHPFFYLKAMKITGIFGMQTYTKNQLALLRMHQHFTQCHQVVDNLVKATKTVSFICF